MLHTSIFGLQIVRTAVITFSVAILAISRSARIFDRRRGEQMSLPPAGPFRSSDQQPLGTGEADGTATILAGEAVEQLRLPTTPSQSRSRTSWSGQWSRRQIPLALRSERLISPSQNWLVDEIKANAASSINVLTERDLVMPPNSGYHCSWFANYTLDDIKVVLVFTMLWRTRGPCARGTPTRWALSHSAFQPFTWRSCLTPRPPMWMCRSSMAMRSCSTGCSIGL